MRGALRVSGAHHGARRRRGGKFDDFRGNPPLRMHLEAPSPAKWHNCATAKTPLFAGEVLSVIGDTWARRRRARAILDHLGLVRAKFSKDLV